MSLLKDKELIKIGIAGDIELTQKGRKVADSIFKKHQMLTVFFRHIAKVSNDIAQADACRIEHVISDETMQGIEQYLKENSLI